MEECEKGQPDNHQPSQSSIICTAQDLAVDSRTATNLHNLLYVLHRVQLSWLSSRALVAQARLPVTAGLFHFPLFSPEF